MAFQRDSEPGRPPDGKIVIINGFPGTGKLTILKRIAEFLPRDKVRLIDNHLLIDPAQAVYPDRSAAHYELRRQIREPVFNAARKLAQEGGTILMTACLADNEADAGVFQEHLAMVRGTDAPLYWVNIHCEQAILEQRVASAERREGTKTKLTDVGVVRKLVSKHRLLRPSRSDAESATLVIETLDVSGTVEEAVGRLLQILDRSLMPTSEDESINRLAS